MWDKMANAVRFMVARGKVQCAAVGPRTLLQVTRYADEVFSSVELLLPPGYVASPLAGADVLLLESGGLADHKLAVGGDNTADTVANLQPGEFGIATAGKRIIMRQGYVEIVDPVQIRLVAPSVVWSPDGGTTFYTLTTNMHEHPTPDGTSGVPIVTATSVT